MITEIDILRGGSPISTFKIDDKTILVKKIMNADKVTSTFISKEVLPVKLGDYIVVNSKNYYIRQPPTIQKQNNKTYKYNAVFHSDLYSLFDKLLISEDGLNDFSYTGNAVDFLTLIVNQMKELDAAWSVGASSEEGVVKTIQFNNESCRTALTLVAGHYNFEFDVVNKEITLKEAIGTVKAYTFQYGQNNGLYSITRKTVENNTLFTKVYGFGGTKNIPYDYRNHAKRLVFQERYLENNVGIYGVKEGHYTNDDIYPQRTAPITASNMEFDGDQYNPDTSYVEDSTLDFNLNDYLSEGLVAKIVFKTGELSGSEFEIWKFDNVNKRIYFNAYVETDGYSLPSQTRKAEVGDEFTLVDIKMPPSYVYQAELDLKAATQKYLDENSVPKTLYLVKVDPKFAKNNTVSLDAGDLVTIIDDQLGINRAIRIAQISYPLTNPYKITAQIADFIPRSLQEQVTISSISTSRIINSIVNNIQNITRNVINNTTINNDNRTVIYGDDLKTITINDHVYVWKKGYDNIVNEEVLEVGDLILDGFWSRFLYVKKWRYLGGDPINIASWEQIESIDFTVSTFKTILQRLKLLFVTEDTAPTNLLSLDVDGNITKTAVSDLRSTKQTFTATANQTVFNITSKPNNVDLVINSVIKMETYHYTYNSTTGDLILTAGADAGDILSVRKYS